MRNDGSSLENLVQYVYSTLLNLRGERIVVAKRTPLQGIRGGTYQVDVYYEFKQVGILHRVVFECKDTSRGVERDEVLTFKAKLEEIGQVVGVMVSRNGYQPAAKSYGQDHNILLLTIDDLPTIQALLAGRIKSFFLPDEYAIGEPFWTLMEIKDGKLTGAYFSRTNPDGYSRIPLFISKKHVAVFHQVNNDLPYVIRGLSQVALKCLTVVAQKTNLKFILVYDVNDPDGKGWAARELSSEEVEQEFLWVDFPS